MEQCIRVLAVLTIMLIAGIETAPPRCLLYKKRCVTHCPRDMHPYDTRCDKDTLSQRTCSSPHVYTLGFTCGWSRCDCNGSKLLDEIQGICLTAVECQTASKKKINLRKAQRRRHMSKIIRVKEDYDFMDV